MELGTPLGFRDILPEEAEEREKLIRSVQELFAENDYKLIETPTLEAMDTVRQGRKLASSPFKFFDSQGDLLAMRPDVTQQVARMCATRFVDSDEPLRLRYTQRVFREADGGAQVAPREVTQIGVERIGGDGSMVDADTEVLMLFLRALWAMEPLEYTGDAPDFTGKSYNEGKLTVADQVNVSVATVAPLKALLERSGASAPWKQSVLAAYHATDLVRLNELAGDAAVAAGAAPAYAEAIRRLPRVTGNASAALEEARALLEPLGCAVGLDELEATVKAVEERWAAGDYRDGPFGDFSLVVDFSIMNSFDYYTGIVFSACWDMGVPLGSGGRYDDMMAAYGEGRPAAGFAFCLENVMKASTLLYDDCQPLRIAVPKGALFKDAVDCLEAVGYDVDELRDPGRKLVVGPSFARNEGRPTIGFAEFIILRPSDIPTFVASGAADCGICGKDSIVEAAEPVAELADLKFGGCKFVVAEPEGAAEQIAERYKKLGSLRVATKYPRITRWHFAKTGTQVDIVKLHGNIELAPLTGMADCIVDITATGTTLAENNLCAVEDVMGSTARFIGNKVSLRTRDVWELLDRLEANAENARYDPIAGGTK